MNELFSIDSSTITIIIDVISVGTSVFCAFKTRKYYKKFKSVDVYESLSHCLAYVVRMKEVYMGLAKIVGQTECHGVNKVVAFKGKVEEIMQLLDKCKSVVPSCYSTELIQCFELEDGSKITDIFLELIDKNDEKLIEDIWQNRKMEIYAKLDEIERFVKELKDKGQEKIFK